MNFAGSGANRTSSLIRVNFRWQDAPNSYSTSWDDESARRTDEMFSLMRIHVPKVDLRAVIVRTIKSVPPKNMNKNLAMI